MKFSLTNGPATYNVVPLPGAVAQLLETGGYTYDIPELIRSAKSRVTLVDTPESSILRKRIDTSHLVKNGFESMFWHEQILFLS